MATVSMNVLCTTLVPLLSLVISAGVVLFMFPCGVSEILLVEVMIPCVVGLVFVVATLSLKVVWVVVIMPLWDVVGIFVVVVLLFLDVVGVFFVVAFTDVDKILDVGILFIDVRLSADVKEVFCEVSELSGEVFGVL